MAKLWSLLAGSGIGRAFRHRVFAVYIVAHAGSVVGLWIQRIAIQWLVWTLTGSYAWLGAIALAEALTSMGFSLASGPIADRLDRVKLGLITQALLMVVATALAVVTYLGWISIPLLAVFVIATGALEGVWAPVRLSIMPNLVPREDMPAAVAITSMMFTAAIFVGPAIGGVIISLVDIEGAFIANAISYVGLLLIFSRIKLPHQPDDGGRHSSFRRDLKVGFKFVLSHAGLRSVILFGFCFSLLIRPYRELFAGVADEFFQMGAEGLAALASAAGLGAFVGAIGIAAYGHTRGLAKVLLWVAGSTVAMLAVFAWSPFFALSLVMAAGLSGCVTVFGTGAQMLIQMSVDDAMRGRVMSVWQAQFRGIPAVGAWLMGLLEPWLGLHAVLAGAAALFAIFVLQTLTWQKHLLRLEQVPDTRESNAEGA